MKKMLADGRGGAIVNLASIASLIGLADRFSHVLMRERSVGSATAFFDIVGAPPPTPEKETAEPSSLVYDFLPE